MKLFSFPMSMDITFPELTVLPDGHFLFFFDC